MTNNDIMKKLRVALHLRNSDIVQILELVDFKASESELTAFFRSEDHEKFRPLGDQMLRNFLNGLVIHMRGPMKPKDPSEAKPKSDVDTKDKSSFKAKRPSDKKPSHFKNTDADQRPPFKGKGRSKINFSSASLKRTNKKPKDNS
jgi:hypothetical protein